jgi:hypothetical protein
MNEDEREYFEERAAILEYEAGFPRQEAERRARQMMRERRQRLNQAIGGK